MLECVWGDEALESCLAECVQSDALQFGALEDDVLQVLPTAERVVCYLQHARVELNALRVEVLELLRLDRAHVASYRERSAPWPDAWLVFYLLDRQLALVQLRAHA